MFLSPTDKEIMSNLKGRVSKLLSGSRKLFPEEKEPLEQLFERIDSIILWDKKITKAKERAFKKNLKMCKDPLEFSKKPYVHNHIIPLLNKLIEQEWIK